MSSLEIESVEMPWLDSDGTVLICINADSDDRYLRWLRSQPPRTGITNTMLHLTHHGDRVLDAGANVGVVSIPLAAAGRRVLAIEAQAENYALLAEGVRRNGLHGRCTPVHVAVGPETGTIRIEGESAFARVDASLTAGATPMMAIDDLAELFHFEEITAAKIDVEGAEPLALAGMEGQLRAAPLQHIVLEGNGAHCHRMGHRLDAVHGPLQQAGFEGFLLRGRRLSPLLDDSFQPFANVDYLFTRAPASLKPHFRHRPLSNDEIVSAMVETLENLNPGYVMFGLGELARHAPDGLARRPEVQAALRGVAARAESGDDKGAGLAEAVQEALQPR